MLAKRTRTRAFLAIAFLFLNAFASFAPVSAAPLRQDLQEPEIGAQAAIVVEYPSGRILYQKAAHERMSPASLTKILTAILALEYGDLDAEVTAMPDDLVGESSMGLISGESVKLRDLLYGLMLPSGNDAGMAIARTLGARVNTPDLAQADPIARFSAMMNTRVSQLGLKDSNFVNPHGLDSADHYSTAYDLASLSWYALHIPLFNDVVRQVGYDAPGHPLLNTNEMLTRYEGADGIKTGWTDGCGLCLVTSATRGDTRLIAVVLNAPQWYSDSAALLDYGFARVEAQPNDSTAETLEVSKRGTVSWLLDNAGPAPPMPLLDGAPSTQGGGVPPGGEQLEVAAASASTNETDVPVVDTRFAALNTAGETGPPFLPLTITAAVGAVLCYMLARKLWGFKPGLAFAGTGARGAHERGSTEGGIRADYSDRSHPSPRPIEPAGRVLGSPPIQRRREPNLLITDTQRQRGHILHALSLAQEGRQGSSMSEFLLALKLGARIDVAELTHEYQLTAAAFLALSRAHSALGYHEEARNTLVHGTIVLPEERLLRLALQQLRRN